MKHMLAASTLAAGTGPSFVMPRNPATQVRNPYWSVVVAVIG